MAVTPHESPKPGIRAILLGFFVLFQLVYLPLANLTQFVPRELPPETGAYDIRKQKEGTLTDVRAIQDSINGLGMLIDRYGEVSGQKQYWSLFAPEFGTQTVFPVIEFEFAAGNDRLLLRREAEWLSADPNHYFRWPSPYSRLFSYEFLLGVVYWNYAPESLGERGPEWRDAIRDHVRRQRRPLDANFRFALAMIRHARPDLPEPRSATLHVRIHPSPRPGERDRPHPYLMPLARWTPAAAGNRTVIEAFDPIDSRFVAVEPE